MYRMREEEEKTICIEHLRYARPWGRHLRHRKTLNAYKFQIVNEELEHRRRGLAKARQSSK